ncbi:SDR family oxidoreductase, partial [Providencia hangzhouensis]
HQPESFLQAYKENTHGAGMLKVDEIIGSILFLLSDQSKYVTGQNIVVDDGFSI